MAPDERRQLFTMRVSERERGQLRELADALGLTESDTVRQLVREKHEERFGRPKVKTKKT